MSYLLDNAVALRTVWLLTLPFDKWPAFKDGIIDKDGKVINEPKKENDDWTMMHRLVSRLKIMLGKLPGGKSQFASLTAAYMLVKETTEYHESSIIDESRLIRKIRFSEFVEFNRLAQKVKHIQEDGETAPANNITNVAGIKPGDEPPKKKKGVKDVRTIKTGIECTTSGRAII